MLEDGRERPTPIDLWICGLKVLAWIAVLAGYVAVVYYSDNLYILIRYGLLAWIAMMPLNIVSDIKELYETLRDYHAP